jgi:hypothetical protein
MRVRLDVGLIDEKLERAARGLLQVSIGSAPIGCSDGVSEPIAPAEMFKRGGLPKTKKAVGEPMKQAA